MHSSAYIICSREERNKINYHMCNITSNEEQKEFSTTCSRQIYERYCRIRFLNQTEQNFPKFKTDI